MQETSMPFAAAAARTSHIAPFFVMEILERAQQLEHAGRSIIHLEVGEPDFPTPPEVAQAAAAAMLGGDTHYTHSLGTTDLRDGIAHRYREHYGVEVSPEQIIVTSGSSPALLYTFAALVGAGDEVLSAAPHYPCYPNIIRFFDGSLIPVPTGPADGYMLNPDDVRQRVTPRTRAIVINSPSNPTGAVLDEERLMAIAELGLPVISDEIYHDIVYEGRSHSILEFTSRAFVVDGFSKRYAMTGWRLGWLVFPPEYARVFQSMQQNFAISANPFVQRAGQAALATGAPAVQRMRDQYRRRRDLMVELFRELGFGIPVIPQGAFYVLADASAFTDDSYAFAFELLEKAGVGVAPGVDFGELGRRAIRLCYAISEDGIREAARRLKVYLPGRS